MQLGRPPKGRVLDLKGNHVHKHKDLNWTRLWLRLPGLHNGMRRPQMTMTASTTSQGEVPSSIDSYLVTSWSGARQTQMPSAGRLHHTRSACLSLAD